MVEVTEDNSGISNAADVFNSVLGTSFTFGETEMEDSKTAEYTFVFDVVQNCSLRPDIKAHVKGIEGYGQFNFYSESIENVLQPQMDAEYIDPTPKPIIVDPKPEEPSQPEEAVEPSKPEEEIVEPE